MVSNSRKTNHCNHNFLNFIFLIGLEIFFVMKIYIKSHLKKVCLKFFPVSSCIQFFKNSILYFEDIFDLSNFQTSRNLRKFVTWFILSFCFMVDIAFQNDSHTRNSYLFIFRKLYNITSFLHF